MLKELNTNKLIVELQKVLILVLMEHAQRVIYYQPLNFLYMVLILVLMEHPQRET